MPFGILAENLSTAYRKKKDFAYSVGNYTRRVFGADHPAPMERLKFIA